MSWLPLRAVLAFAVMPGVVAFLVPWVLLDSRAPDSRLDPIALVPLTLGGALLLWSVIAFYRRGRGTLAPWDPPQELVDTGLYAFSRNPMYVGVSLLLWGWALGFHLLVHFIYAAIVTVAFHLRVVFGEEPWLAAKYGERWTRYKDRVPRWFGVPRRTAVVALTLGVTTIVAAQGGAQSRDVFPALTVPASRLPEGCRLTAAGSPAVRTFLEPQITIEGGFGFPTNPWIGRDQKLVALIRQSIDGAAAYPDGPPLSAPEMAALQAAWSNHVVDAYRASYSMGDAVAIVIGIRFDDEALTRAEAPIGKRSRPRGESTRVVLGSTVAVVHSPGRNPCYDAIAAYVRALK